MDNSGPSYRGHRFPAEIISHSVWLYYRFCLSFRDVEDLLAERGVTASYETIRQWSRKFGSEYARRYCQVVFVRSEMWRCRRCQLGFSRRTSPVAKPRMNLLVEYGD